MAQVNHKRQKGTRKRAGWMAWPREIVPVSVSVSGRVGAMRCDEASLSGL